MPGIPAPERLRIEDLKFVSALCSKFLSWKEVRGGKERGREGGRLSIRVWSSVLGEPGTWWHEWLTVGRHFQECPV